MIALSKQGSGDPVVLIHGFPMHAKVWDPVVTELKKSFTVVTLDLPGFGASPLPNTPFSIDDIATQVSDALREQIKGKMVIVGHSLGGYVALALAHAHADIFQGMILLHSTAQADSDEKKLSRTKVVEFIRGNGVEAFTSNFIQPLFADKGHPAISKVRKINMESSEAAVVNYTLAMRNRPDRSGLIRDVQFPVLYIAGDLDPGIPVSSIQEQCKSSGQASLHILKGQSHMALVEDPLGVSNQISAFTHQSFASKG